MIVLFYVINYYIGIMMQSKAEAWEAAGGEKGFVQKILMFIGIWIRHIATDDVVEFLQLACVPSFYRFLLTSGVGL